MFMPTIVVGGQVVGTWRKTLKRKALVVDLIPFRKLTRAQIDACTPIVQKLGVFWGAEATLGESEADVNPKAGRAPKG